MANTETKKMSEIVHWTLFLSCAATIGLKTIEFSSANSSYIVANIPSIAQYSWLVTGII